MHLCICAFAHLHICAFVLVLTQFHGFLDKLNLVGPFIHAFGVCKIEHFGSIRVLNAFSRICEICTCVRQLEHLCKKCTCAGSCAFALTCMFDEPMCWPFLAIIAMYSSLRRFPSHTDLMKLTPFNTWSRYFFQNENNLEPGNWMHLGREGGWY